MGLFGFTTPGDEYCRSYEYMLAINPDNTDMALTSMDKFAQAAGILACILGVAATIVFFLSFFLQCLLKMCTSRIVLPILLIIAGVFQILTFTAAEHMCRCPPSALTLGGGVCPVKTGCTVSDGGNRAIAATVLYLFVGILIIFYPRRTTPLFDVGAKGAPVEKKEAGDRVHASLPYGSPVAVGNVQDPNARDFNV